MSVIGVSGQDSRPRYIVLDKYSLMKGGAGSGNFGHSGRPGEIGGSSSAGSMMDKPSSFFTPSRPDGLDTKERFSDGKGNYTEQRAALHEAIMAKYLAGTSPVAGPTAIILGGGPGTGKTTLVNQQGLVGPNTVSVSADDIRDHLPEFKPSAGKPISVAETHEEASDIAKALTARAGSGSRNIVLDGTGDTTLQKLGGKIAALKATGHAIIGEYVTTSIAEAQQRADARGQRTGRFVPPTALREMHRAVSGIFPEAVKQGLFDKARLWDTSGPLGSKATLVAKSTGRVLTVYDTGMWNSFVEKQ